jgi:hypothetical protein
MENFLKCFQEMNLSLSNENCFMLMNDGIVLGNHISLRGIEVDLEKINITQHLKDKNI